MNRSAFLTTTATLLVCSVFSISQAQEKKSPSTTGKPAAAKPNDSPAKLGLADDGKIGRLPSYTTGLSDLAAQAFARKDWDKARTHYLEMLSNEPDNPLTLANIGAVEQQAGRLKEAKNYLLRAVKINPALQQSWLALGLVCHEMGDSYLAVSALSRAAYEDPLDPKAHNYLAVVARSLGWLDAAEAELQRAIELKPDYANAHFNLALMYLDRKPPSVELAKRHYNKAVTLGAEKDEVVEEKLKGH
ncbi:MAG: tetratricopeptide repeat protein [Verrucomicrobia bacterium]|nr:tetratricopeptide repeat protein [Verrucomicrobiota bacterium]